MDDIKKYIQQLFSNKSLHISPAKSAVLDQLAEDEKTVAIVHQIIDLEKLLMQNYEIKNRVDDIIRQQVMVPNGNTGKAYEAKLDFEQLGWDDIIVHQLSGTEGTGFMYDPATGIISGVPSVSGDVVLKLLFRINAEEETAEMQEKKITLIINPDPKSLWKNKESDLTDPFWKEDDKQAFEKLGDKNIVASSRRGRSHANVGGFREDDFGFRQYENGWNIVAVSDGAGSARFSREGSRIACEKILEFFAQQFNGETDTEFDGLIHQYRTEGGTSSEKNISGFIYKHLNKGAQFVHQQIAEAAIKAKAELKDFHATLVFTLFKKYSEGYAFLSFGVGDCPMAVLSSDGSKQLLNDLDVGEFSGGTRFITMPEIFTGDALAKRVRFKWLPGFSYLILMTDGIYDPKFAVEAALDNDEKWREFMADLEGHNPEGTAVEFKTDNKNIADQLSAWMEFWSPGNHDDRTLAIVF